MKIDPRKLRKGFAVILRLQHTLSPIEKDWILLVYTYRRPNHLERTGHGDYGITLYHSDGGYADFPTKLRLAGLNEASIPRSESSTIDLSGDRTLTASFNFFDFEGLAMRIKVVLRDRSHTNPERRVSDVHPTGSLMQVA